MENEIAIVGVGCRFPGAENLQQFWEVLKNGENHVCEVDDDRWDFKSFYDPDVNAEGKSYVNKAGLLKDIDKWDNQLFGVTDNEAKVVDPQQKIVLDCCHMAMENAGITRESLDGSNSSVYIGAMNDDFKSKKTDFTSSDSAYAVTGIFRSITSARVSYAFNLKGPCMVVDTACSSSLVAIHLACQSLLQKECDLSFAGGVSILLDPFPFVALSKAHMLSPTGQCHTFSSEADGYARGEGCGIVILQRLEDAIRDGNNVYGVIKTGINQDGRMATPITAPSGKQQLDLLRRVYGNNTEDRDSIQVIESHGTGTALGDPTEVDALGTFFKDCETAKKQKILIGSVKTNIGHLESASGVAGLIKVLLMMEHETIVPSLLYSEEKRNPKLNFNYYNMTVPTKEKQWEVDSGQSRTACVNSFGFGGSNSHLIVKQWNQPISPYGKSIHLPTTVSKLFLFSSLKRNGLVQNLKTFLEDLQTTSASLEEISYTSIFRRDHFKFRVAITASSKRELEQECKIALQGFEENVQRGTPQYVFVFCGVGTTWKGMCSELLQCKIFRVAVKPIDRELQSYTGWSLVDKLINKEDVSDPFIGHLSIFLCQIGIASMWKDLGIVPTIVVGQSVGEVAACYVAGTINKKTAVRIIYYRSLLLSTCQEGSMIVVRNVVETKVRDVCQKLGKVNIAVHISPTSCTVAGEKDSLDRLETVLQTETNAKIRKLDVACGYHSPLVEEAGEKLKLELTDHLKQGQDSGKTKVISTVYGRSVNVNDFCKASYWRDNVIKPVHFHKAILQAKSKNQNTIFIEIGPSPVLKAHAMDILGKGAPYMTISSMEKGREYSAMLKALANVYELGGKVNFEALLENHREIKPSPIPRYAFNKKHFPLPRLNSIHQLVASPKIRSVDHNYIKFKDVNDLENFMEITLSPETASYVYGHVVRGMVIVPGAVYADVGFEIGKVLLDCTPEQISVTLDFLKAVPLIEKETISMIARLKKFGDGDGVSYRFGVICKNEIVCSGEVRKADMLRKRTYMNLTTSSQDCIQSVSASDIYGSLEYAGFKYGRQLNVLRGGVMNSERALLNLELSSDIFSEISHCDLHPCILDGMLQTTCLFTFQSMRKKQDLSKRKQFLPVGMDALTVSKQLNNISETSSLRILTEKVIDTNMETMEKQHFNMFLIDEYGFILAEVKNFVLYAANSQIKCPDDLKYSISWEKTKENLQTFAPIRENEDRILVVNANADFTSALCTLKGDIFDHTRVHETSDREWIDLDKELSSYSHILMFFDPNLQDEEHVENGIFEKVSRNCRLLQSIMVFLKGNHHVIPLFLITKGVNAAHYPEKYRVKTSVIGSEICGFYRNAQAELVYEKTTLVDIASYSADTIETLYLLMSKHKMEKEERGGEYVICQKDVFEMCVQHCTKRFKMPSLRVNHCPDVDSSTTFTLCSRRERLVDEHFFVMNGKSEASFQTPKQSHINFSVEEICIHDSAIYPATDADLSDVFGTLFEVDQERGFKVYAIEFQGRQIPSKTNHKTLYRMSKQQARDNELYVACYPIIASNIVSIPEECCICISTIPQYQPGLVSTSLILWELLDSVPNKSELFLVGNSAISLHTNVRAMLRKKGKICTVVITEKDTVNTKIDDRFVAAALVLDFTENPKTIDFLKRFSSILTLSSCLSDKCKDSLLKEGKHLHLLHAKSFFDSKDIRAKMLELKNFFRETEFKAYQDSSAQQKWFGKSLRTIVFHHETRTWHGNQNDYVVKAKVNQKMLFSKTAAYIVVGGRTGLGWITTELLAEMGAGLVATLGRRGCDDEQLFQTKHLEDTFGCKIVHCMVNVTDYGDVVQMVEDLSKRFPMYTIRGVFQGAGVIRSARLEVMTVQQMDDVLRPKVLGTVNLFNATKHLKLDYFVILSSISSIVGTLAHTNYGAANSFLDAFAFSKRQQGFNVQSINWGAISSGMAAVESVARELEQRGHILVKKEEFRTCFLHALMTNETNVIYANLDHDVLLLYYNNPDMHNAGKKLVFLWDHLYMTGKTTDDIGDQAFTIETFRALTKDERKQTIEQMLVQFSSSATAIQIEEIDVNDSFGSLGIDSMGSITIANLIRNYYGVHIKSEKMIDPATTIVSIATLVIDEMTKKL